MKLLAPMSGTLSFWTPPFRAIPPLVPIGFPTLSNGVLFFTPRVFLFGAFFPPGVFFLGAFFSPGVFVFLFGTFPSPGVYFLGAFPSPGVFLFGTFLPPGVFLSSGIGASWASLWWAIISHSSHVTSPMSLTPLLGVGDSWLIPLGSVTPLLGVGNSWLIPLGSGR